MKKKLEWFKNQNYSPAIAISIILLLSGCIKQEEGMQKERERRSTDELNAIRAQKEAPSKPLSLREVVFLTMRQNFDVQLQALELEVQYEKATSSLLKALPSLTWQKQTNHRNNVSAAFSRVLNAKGEPVPLISANGSSTATASYSVPRKYFERDLTAAISVIDFGISFLRGCQEKQQYYNIAQKQLRFRQNLVLDVAKAYWNVCIAKKIMDEAAYSLYHAKDVMQALQWHMDEQHISSLQGAGYSDQIEDLGQKVENYTRAYYSSKAQLAGLMGVPPDSTFELADEYISIDIKPLKLDIAQLERDALTHRPELYSQDIQERIQADEAIAQFLLLFPNAQISYEKSHSNNHYLLHEHWWNIGTQVTINLLSLPSQLLAATSASEQKLYLKKAHLAIAMGILSQLHIAYLDYQHFYETYQVLKQGLLTSQSLVASATKSAQLGALSSAEKTKFELQAIVAKSRALQAYSDLMISTEQLSNVLGRPLFFYKDNLQPFPDINEFLENIACQS
jgi:outer membrane protein, multidrug efflux system